MSETGTPTMVDDGAGVIVVVVVLLFAVSDDVPELVAWTALSPVPPVG